MQRPYGKTKNIRTSASRNLVENVGKNYRPCKLASGSLLFTKTMGALRAADTGGMTFVPLLDTTEDPDAGGE